MFFLVHPVIWMNILHLVEIMDKWTLFITYFSSNTILLTITRRKPKHLQKHKRSLSEHPHTKLFDNKHLIDVHLLERSKLVWQRWGNLKIQLYPSRSIESTSVLHTNYLLRYIS